MAFKAQHHILKEKATGNELVDYSRAPCLGADQKARGLWERDCDSCRKDTQAQAKKKIRNVKFYCT